MMKRGFGWAMIVLGLVACGSAAAADGTVFDTEGHAKVKGIRVLVTYPKGFDAHEHMDGYVVQEFTRKSGELEENLTLQLFDVDEDEAKAGFAVPGAMRLEERQEHWKKTQEQLDTTKTDDIRDVKADGKPAVLVSLAIAHDGMMDTPYMRVQMLNIYDRGQSVILTCSVSGPGNEKEQVDRLYAKSANAVCKPFFDSVRLMSAK